MAAGGVSPWTAAIACACPRCGEGKLFRGFLSLADHCTVCGLDLREMDSGDGPAVFLIFILGFTAIPIALVLGLAYDLPDWAPILIGSAIVLVLAAILLRPAKALVVALQYRHRGSGG